MEHKTRVALKQDHTVLLVSSYEHSSERQQKQPRLTALLPFKVGGVIDDGA